MEKYKLMQGKYDGIGAKMQISNVVDLFCDISDIIEDIADKIQIMLIARKA